MLEPHELVRYGCFIYVSCICITIQLCIDAFLHDIHNCSCIFNRCKYMWRVYKYTGQLPFLPTYEPICIVIFRNLPAVCHKLSLTPAPCHAPHEIPVPCHKQCGNGILCRRPSAWWSLYHTQYVSRGQVHNHGGGSHKTSSPFRIKITNTILFSCMKWLEI